jgi:rubrerythrin
MKTKQTLSRIRGFLTKDDIALLEEASQRPVKPRKPAERFRCIECNYTWLYKAARCPLCSSSKTKSEGNIIIIKK